MRVACTVVGGLGVGGVVEDGAGDKYERAWWLASRHSRVGHVDAVVWREGRVVMTRWRGRTSEEMGRGWEKQKKRRERYQGRIDMRER